MTNQFFKTWGETKAWLDNVGIDFYTIRDDLTVDVVGDVDVSRGNLTTIPVQFGVIDGDFNCRENKLTSLVGSPSKCLVFDCCYNRITSLDGAPAVCEYFYCSANQITHLEGTPVRSAIGFYCAANQLTSLAGVSADCQHIDCTNNPDLYDISTAPDGCVLVYNRDVVSKNQACRQLAMLESEKRDVEVLRPNPGRML